MFGFSWTKVLRVSSTSGSSWYWSLLYLSSAWLHHHHQHHPDQFALMQLDIYTISLNIPGCSMLVWKMSKAWHRPVARCGQTQKTTINNMNQPETVDTNTKHINCVIRPDTQHILMFTNNCNFNSYCQLKHIWDWLHWSKSCCIFVFFCVSAIVLIFAH